MGAKPIYVCVRVHKLFYFLLCSMLLLRLLLSNGLFEEERESLFARAFVISVVNLALSLPRLIVVS